MSKLHMNRRTLLKGLAACAAGAAVTHPSQRMGALIPPAYGQTDGDKKPKFLIVIGAFGGASIIDSMLAVRASECDNSDLLNTFPDELVKDIPGSPFRAVDMSRPGLGQIDYPFEVRQSDFVQKHTQDMMVVTQTGTSVNHGVGQRRSITGNDAWNGRTLQEAMALEYGASVPVPNVNMSAMGFLEHGSDPTLPAYCYYEAVTQPSLWPLSLHGSRGIKGAPRPDLIAMARQVRDQKLDPESIFVRTFQNSERLKRWQAQRALQPNLESADLITKLNIIANSPEFPLSEYGLDSSPDGERLRGVFPRFQLDPLEAQAALAFLLIKNRVSVAVTLSPTFDAVFDVPEIINPPLSFDYSHQAHRSTQAFMWNRLLNLIDRLIDLLKSEEFDTKTGESLWDRTLIYVATDFGRTKKRQLYPGTDEFSSAHDLNNGTLLISPLVNGNKVLGGIDPQTCLTYGYDPQTGQPDINRNMLEAETYAGILQTLGVSTTGSGLPDMAAMRRNG